MNRTKLALTAIAAALALALVACGGSNDKPVLPSSSPTPTAAPFPGDTWQLAYNVSGGIDGRNYSMTLGTDGVLKLQDKRNKLDVTRTIDAAELRKIAGLLASSGFTNPPPTRNNGCADCIDITISVTTGGRTYTATTNEVNRQPRLDQLLAELNTLYQSTR